MEKIMENRLNMVTGGSFDETSIDSQALYFKGFMDEQFDVSDLVFHWLSESAKVDAGWAKAGITCVTCPFYSNRYYIKNKRISRDTAMKMIGIITLS